MKTLIEVQQLLHFHERKVTWQKMHFTIYLIICIQVLPKEGLELNYTYKSDGFIMPIGRQTARLEMCFKFLGTETQRRLFVRPF